MTTVLVHPLKIRVLVDHMIDVALHLIGRRLKGVLHLSQLGVITAVGRHETSHHVAHLMTIELMRPILQQLREAPLKVVAQSLEELNGSAIIEVMVCENDQCKLLVRESVPVAKTAVLFLVGFEDVHVLLQHTQGMVHIC